MRNEFSTDAEELAARRDFMRGRGFRSCDIMACNCNSWHGGHADRRLAEFDGLLRENGLLSEDKGGVLHAFTAYEGLERLIAAWNTRAAPTKLMAKHQPCGCQVCVCENDDQCQGCGAKSCGNHPVGEIPHPVYQSIPAPTVKPLVWDGFTSGPYQIEVRDGGIADLYFHGSRDEYGDPEQMRGGYLTLVSLDDLKAEAQAHHAARILSALEDAT